MEQNRAAFAGGLGGVVAVIVVLAILGTSPFAFVPLVVAALLLVVLMVRGERHGRDGSV
jgi:Flp pilus assembly protein TadB